MYSALSCRFGAKPGGRRWVVVGGAKRPKLHQIGRWWAQGRLVVAMGRTSAWGVVVVSVGGPHGPWWVPAASDTAAKIVVRVHMSREPV